jgi:hypothetical protein
MLFALSLKYDKSSAFIPVGFAALICLISIIPIPIDVHKFATSYLLDRPIIDLGLYIPFSILGGISFERIISHLKTYRWKSIFQFVLLSIVIVPGLNPNNFQPNPITVYVKLEDREIIEWINDNLDCRSLVYIPAAVYPNKLTGLDAGIWITPLTGVRSEKVPYSYDLSDVEYNPLLCSDNGLTEYMFSGTTNYSFRIQDFMIPDMFELVVYEGDAKLYQINCK